MQIVINTKGQARGKVCLKQTLLSMDINEVWTVSDTSFGSLSYLRTAASALYKNNNMVFSINAKKTDNGMITVKRTQ